MLYEPDIGRAPLVKLALCAAENFGVMSLALLHVGRLDGWIDWSTSRDIIREDPLFDQVGRSEYAPELAESRAHLPLLDLTG